MMEKSHSFFISVTFTSRGQTNTYRFETLVEEENRHTMWMYIAPRKVPEERKGCVTISFDPRPSRGSLTNGYGRQAVLQSLYFDGRCSAYDDPPLDPKQGTRAMLLGAIHVFRYLVRHWWPHVTILTMSDQSTYKCKPKFENKIRTFATDLLTGDLTYYERHLGATMESPANRSIRRGVRMRMTSPIDRNGHDFGEAMTLQIQARTRAQERWVSQHADEMKYLLDQMRSTGHSWQEYFTEIKRRFGCEMYACCAENLVTFFGMSVLMGAVYSVELDRVSGTSRIETDENLSHVHASIQAGGGCVRNRRISMLRQRVKSCIYHRSRGPP